MLELRRLVGAAAPVPFTRAELWIIQWDRVARRGFSFDTLKA